MPELTATETVLNNTPRSLALLLAPFLDLYPAE